MASNSRQTGGRGCPARLCKMVGLVLLLCSAAASAQELAPDTRRAALELAAQGDEAWARGDFTAALGKFAQARALVPAPTLAVRHGECLEKLGRLIDAAKVFQEAADFSLPANASEPFRKAVAAARPRAEATQARIPLLEIVVQAEQSAQATVSLDGQAVPQEQWASPFRVDPGAHLVKAVAGGAEASERVVLEEGARVRVVLRPERPADAVAAAKPAPSPDVGASPTKAEERRGSLRTWAWVGLGIGAAGTLAGLATGIAVLKMRNDLDDSGCTGSVCKTSQGGDVRTYNRLRTASVAGFVVGGLGIATGAILWLVEPRSDRVNRQAFMPFVAPGSVGVAGVF
jgi:hypothetical protein